MKTLGDLWEVSVLCQDGSSLAPRYEGTVPLYGPRRQRASKQRAG